MYQDKSILAVITARANSQGLHGKNYKNLYGKPLVNWSVLAALRCSYIDTVVVSSNCPHVKDAVADFRYSESNFHFIQRPEELSTSSSLNEEALLHAVQVYEQKTRKFPDIIVNLQPTSPIRTNMLLNHCIEKMIETESDSLFTASAHTPFFWTVDDSENWTPSFDVLSRPMRQALTRKELFFHDNGNVYLMTNQILGERMCRIGEMPFIYETDVFQSLQIDTESDFKLVEAACNVLDGPI